MPTRAKGDGRSAAILATIMRWDAECQVMSRIFDVLGERVRDVQLAEFMAHVIRFMILPQVEATRAIGAIIASGQAPDPRTCVRDNDAIKAAHDAAK